MKRKAGALLLAVTVASGGVMTERECVSIYDGPGDVLYLDQPYVEPVPLRPPRLSSGGWWSGPPGGGGGYYYNRPPEPDPEPAPVPVYAGMAALSLGALLLGMFLGRKRRK